MDNPQLLGSFDARAALKGPYSRYPITLKEAERQAKIYSRKIFNTWGELNKILEGREGVLRKRWKKNTVEQRKKILLRAWFGMPAKHRPDLDLITQSQGSRVLTKDVISAFKWPHISLEDLTPVNSLLLLINSLGRNQPHVFANAEVAACHAGLLSHNLKITHFNKHIMSIAGQTVQEDFGVTTPLSDTAETFLY